LTSELKTVYSFWIPVRILDSLRGTAENLEKKNGVKITPNQLAMRLIDKGLEDQKVIKSIIRDDEERDVPSGSTMVTNQTPEQQHLLKQSP